MFVAWHRCHCGRHAVRGRGRPCLPLLQYLREREAAVFRGLPDPPSAGGGRAGGRGGRQSRPDPLRSRRTGARSPRSARVGGRRYLAHSLQKAFRRHVRRRHPASARRRLAQVEVAAGCSSPSEQEIQTGDRRGSGARRSGRRHRARGCARRRTQCRTRTQQLPKNAGWSDERRHSVRSAAGMRRAGAQHRGSGEHLVRAEKGGCGGRSSWCSLLRSHQVCPDVPRTLGGGRRSCAGCGTKGLAVGYRGVSRRR